MMNLMRMVMRHPKNRSDTLHAVRMIETSERSSSIMKATHQLDALKEDPVLQVFSTFGQCVIITRVAFIAPVD
jgi:hypothetical protein